MNKETYEALKDLTAYLELARANKQLTPVLESELNQVNKWIDEASKEYKDEDCKHENTHMTNDGTFCADCGASLITP